MSNDMDVSKKYNEKAYFDVSDHLKDKPVYLDVNVPKNIVPQLSEEEIFDIPSRLIRTNVGNADLIESHIYSEIKIDY